tara:strand:- start:107 stop:292 length:186 start_codon:yes stop_codon:yes gene_type:complete
MAQDKSRELLSLLLQTQNSLETNPQVPVHIKNKYNLDRINKAISIVEDSIRYKRAFFTVEE